VTAREADKPSLLHALVLHLIKHDRHRPALDELETYLLSYPYLLSGSLHTYAGMLSYYLAQPPSARAAEQGHSRPGPITERAARSLTVSSDEDGGPSFPSRAAAGSPNAVLIRQARGWFAKALDIDPRDEVASEFIEIIDHPESATPPSEDNAGAMGQNGDEKADESSETESMTSDDSLDSLDEDTAERADHAA